MATYYTVMGMLLVAFAISSAAAAPVVRQTDCPCADGSDSTKRDESDTMSTECICSTSTSSSVCFSADDYVYTDDPLRIQKTMQELEIGDRVLSVTKDGNTVFSPVITFLTRVEHGTYRYIELETNSGHSLKLTPDHLIFRNDSDQPVFASEIKPGDYVFTVPTNSAAESDSIQMQESKIIAVRSFDAALGGYSPLTLESTVIVNGVSASCFGGFADQYFIHAAFAPLRFLHRVMPNAVEIQPDGKHWYVRSLQHLGQYMRPLSSLIVNPIKIHPNDMGLYSIF